jgi:hypothetical protein
MLGINQSIKADPEALNKYFENLEVFYNQRLESYSKQINSDPYFAIDEFYVEEEESIIKNGFNARRFGIDEVVSYYKRNYKVFDESWIHTK